MTRGAKPGERRGGRTKGTPNKRTAEVQAKLDELGCDPIQGMAQIALDESNPKELRAQMYKELAQYIAPKRRATEISGEIGMTYEDALDEI